MRDEEDTSALLMEGSLLREVGDGMEGEEKERAGLRSKRVREL